MPISLQSDAVLPQGHILVDGQRVASFSTTGGLSAILNQNTVTTLSIQNSAVTTEKINNNAITAEKLDSIGQGAGNPPVYACRAWVNFDGTLAGPITPRASGNISSITKNTGNANYTVNFITHMPDTNYVFGVMSNFAGGSGGIPVPHQSTTFLRDLGSFTFQISDANAYATQRGQQHIYVFVFR